MARFLRPRMLFSHLTNTVKALTETRSTDLNHGNHHTDLVRSSSTSGLRGEGGSARVLLFAPKDELFPPLSSLSLTFPFLPFTFPPVSPPLPSLFFPSPPMPSLSFPSPPLFFPWKGSGGYRSCRFCGEWVWLLGFSIVSFVNMRY